MQHLYTTLPTSTAVVPFTPGNFLKMVVPMMTAARPKTIWPVPMVLEKLRCSWQTTEPARATRALAMTRPRIFILPLSWASVVTRVALSPVARRSMPFLVLKYRSKISLKRRTRTRETINFLWIRDNPPSKEPTGAATKMVSTSRPIFRFDPAI